MLPPGDDIRLTRFQIPKPSEASNVYVAYLTPAGQFRNEMGVLLDGIVGGSHKQLSCHSQVKRHTVTTFKMDSEKFSPAAYAFYHLPCKKLLKCFCFRICDYLWVINGHVQNGLSGKLRLNNSSYSLYFR